MHAQYYHWFASLADKLGGRTIPMDASVHAFTTRHPVGVVGAITPWNVPLMAAAWKLGPALRSEEHTSELQSLMRTSYAVFCLTNKNTPLPNAKTLHRTQLKNTTPTLTQSTTKH